MAEEQDQLATIGYKIFYSILVAYVIVYVGKPLLAMAMGLDGSESACTLCDPLTRIVITSVFGILVVMVFIYKFMQVF